MSVSPVCPSLSVCFFGLFLLPVRCKYFAGRSSGAATASVAVDVDVNCNWELRMRLLFCGAWLLLLLLLLLQLLLLVIFCSTEFIVVVVTGTRKVYTRKKVIFLEEPIRYCGLRESTRYELILLVLCLSNFRHYYGIMDFLLTCSIHSNNIMW